LRLLPCHSAASWFPRPNDSGIAGYDLYVSVDGGTYFPLLTDTTETSTSFTGEFNHTYAFYSLAHDNVGHVQPIPSSSQATTRLVSLDTIPPTSSVSALPAVTYATSLTVSWSGSDNAGGSGIGSYDIYVSTDGGPFAPFLTGTTQTSATFSGEFGHTYAFYSIATDQAGNRQSTPSAAQAVTQLLAAPAVLQFGAAQVVANATAGSATIQIDRSGNLGATVTVVLSGPGGHDVAPFSETISFGPNVQNVWVSIPIVNDRVPGESDVVIPLSLSSPGTGAALGARPSASLVIHDDNSPLVTVLSAKVATVKVTAGKKAKKTTGIVLQFSGPLNAAQASSLSSYRVLAGKVKKSRTTFSKTLPLSSAIYSSSANTVTLVTKSKLNLAQPEEVVVIGALLMDAFGRPIDGNNDGEPGGNFTATLSKKGTTITSARSSSRIALLRADAVDSLIESGGVDIKFRKVRQTYGK
jgi:hypothetical protein